MPGLVIIIIMLKFFIVPLCTGVSQCCKETLTEEQERTGLWYPNAIILQDGLLVANCELQFFLSLNLQ